MVSEDRGPSEDAAASAGRRRVVRFTFQPSWREMDGRSTNGRRTEPRTHSANRRLRTHRVINIEVGKEVKTVNCVNYEFSGERWLAGSGFRVTLGDVDINTPSLQADLGT